MPFDRQPTLTSDLLEMRPLVAEDFDALWSISSDPLLWEQHPSKERSTPEGFRAWFDEAMASGGTLVAVDRADGAVIGTSRFHWCDDEQTELEIGWTFLERSRWGGGSNAEMKRLMLRHAFASVGYVVFKVHSENTRSRKAVEKLGAVLIGDETDPQGRGTNVVYRLEPGPHTG